MDEFDTSPMRETMSEVYDRMTAETAEEDADRQADQEYLSSLNEEELLTGPYPKSIRRLKMLHHFHMTWALFESK